jgi:hypothetical protein
MFSVPQLNLWALDLRISVLSGCVHHAAEVILKNDAARRAKEMGKRFMISTFSLEYVSECKIDADLEHH